MAKEASRAWDRSLIPLLALAVTACGSDRRRDFMDDPRMSAPQGATQGDAGATGLDPDAPLVGEPGAEDCNGYDDNEDGRVDEGCNCRVGQKQDCWPSRKNARDEELCAPGLQRCIADGEFAGWGSCEAFVRCEPRLETFVYGEEAVSRPVDIVWVVDQSGSMSDEIANVQANLNRFATTISRTGLDYHVILVSGTYSGSAHNICVPPPLGGPGCGNGPRFSRVEQWIESTDALSRMMEHITTIESVMRQGSLRVFVAVTDDNSYVSADQFDQFLLARPGYEDYLFHGVIGESTAICSGTASPGTVYIELARRRGGLIEPICSPDWGASFDRFADTIVVRNLVYELEATPYEGTLEVWFRLPNGHEVVQPVDVAWRYDAERNAIVLLDGYTPAPGVTILARYRIARS